MITIRQAKRKDAREIAKVYVDAWRDSYASLIPTWVLTTMSYRRLARAWDRAIRTSGKDEAILVSEHQRHGIIGIGSCGPSRDSVIPYAGEVYTLYVHPSHSGVGNGTHLLENLFERLNERGRKSAIIWALANNPHRKFYKARGGGIVATRRGRQWGMSVHEVGYGWPDLTRLRAR